MKRMLAWLYAPLVFAGFIGAGVWWMSAGPASASGLLGVFGAALGVSFLAEWCLLYEPGWNRSQGDRLRDSLHACLLYTSPSPRDS